MAFEKTKRAFSWLSRRSSVDKIVDHAGRGFDVGADAWNEVRRPRMFSKDAFYGTDEDGGIKRFHRQSNWMRADDIEAAAKAWARDRDIYLFATIIAILLIPFSVFYGYFSVYTLLSLLFFGLFLFVKALGADYRYWQIHQGRFGPLVDYLNHRLPINMHIMKKD